MIGGNFNFEMLTLARESRGLSQTAFADALGMSQGEVSKIENGLRVPTSEQASRFAAHLHYAEEFFFIEESVRNLGSGCIYHRKRVQTPERVLRRLLAMVNICRIQIRRLLTSVDLEVENKFESFDLDDNGNDPAKIAQKIRFAWGIPPGPVNNLIREIEDAGGIVIRCEFGTAKVDALSQWVPGMPPLLFVNIAIPTDRLRWSLAHEIGHIIMHHVPTDTMEREADQFAAEFLMPRKDIRPQLHEVNLQRLAALKPHWRVAMSALLRRAGDLGTVTPRWKAYLWTQMGKFGYRRTEPVSISPEEPTLLDEIINTYRQDLGYSHGDLDKLLYGLETALSEALKPHTYKLRIVG